MSMSFHPPVTNTPRGHEEGEPVSGKAFLSHAQGIKKAGRQTIPVIGNGYLPANLSVLAESDASVGHHRTSALAVLAGSADSCMANIVYRLGTAGTAGGVFGSFENRITVPLSFVS